MLASTPGPIASRHGHPHLASLFRKQRPEGKGDLPKIAWLRGSEPRLSHSSHHLTGPEGTASRGFCRGGGGHREAQRVGRN